MTQSESKPPTAAPNDIWPLATYRLQFNAGFALERAKDLAGYFADLGVSQIYASPLFRARESSSHGYDVVDHSVIDPSIGSEADFQELSARLKSHGLGIMLDVVPNHMGIDDKHNNWWQEVLESGHSSPYAKYFDIDWNPPKAAMKNKVLLPFLGDQFGAVLERQELRLDYNGERFTVHYFDRSFPVAPESFLLVLRDVVKKIQVEQHGQDAHVATEHGQDSHATLTPDDPDGMELESIVTALENLPHSDATEADAMRLRQREKEVVRRRLAAVCASSEAVRTAIDRTVEEFNGCKGNPQSFDKLEELLDLQPYRLCYWRVASDEVNYRRFFDINELAAIRVEDPDVFRAVHAMVFRFHEQGLISSLRIDHPDGLLDPQQYFEDLQRCLAHGYKEEAPPGNNNGNSENSGEQLPAMVGNDSPAASEKPPFYIAVEKILAFDERLPETWPVSGTTGYDAMNLINHLFVDRGGVHALRGIYARLTGQPNMLADILHQSKNTILSFNMSSEFYVLASHLERLSQQHRRSRDFTRSALQRALREVIACFPVYRTYIRPGGHEVRKEDRACILMAIRAAKRRSPAMTSPAFDFIASVLLLDYPEGLSDADRSQRLDFVLRFQQVTGPVMAKGLEDTAFYRWYPLASLNEVGGDPMIGGISAEEFHRRNVQRLADWPHSMNATATHDSKRGEDMRARLNVLSEVPSQWDAAVRRWQSMNERYRTELDGVPAPDCNEEYLLYQTLVGTWPTLGPMMAPTSASRQRLDDAEAGESTEDDAWTTYVNRIAAYMDKALKEAKLHTSWANPDEPYGQAMENFIRSILDPELSGPFLADFDVFVREIADAGWINALSQTVLKVFMPGLPDFYQGTELWDFHLVDPDNRGAVDFDHRRKLLGNLKQSAGANRAALLSELLSRWPDERLKMFLIWQALECRRRNQAACGVGAYTPLVAEGPKADHICALVRSHSCPTTGQAGRSVIVIVPRLVRDAARGVPGTLRLFGPRGSYTAWWKGTALRIPNGFPARWRHALLGSELESKPTANGHHTLNLTELFAICPWAILEGVSE